MEIATIALTAISVAVYGLNTIALGESQDKEQQTPLAAYLLAEDGTAILTEDGQPLIL